MIQKSFIITFLAVFSALALSWLPACNPFYACEPSEPFEAIIVASFMRSYTSNGKMVLNQVDTVQVGQAGGQRIDFLLQAIPKSYAVHSQAAHGFFLFTAAHACSPAYLPYTFQRYQGIKITSDIPFGSDYPAGADLSPLFELQRWNEGVPGVSLRRVLDSLGLEPLMSDLNSCKAYTFRGTTAPGSMTRFYWELYIDNDTLRTQSNWWQF